MKKLAVCLLACWSLAQGDAADSRWSTDLEKAKARAKKENKAVLIDFTGSDWCGWCIKFNKEVLSKNEFKKFANKNLILVELDYPRKKQSEELKKTNAKLKSQYKVRGFPTFVVLDSQGKEIGRQVGYSKGGPVTFIKKIEGFKDFNNNGKS